MEQKDKNSNNDGKPSEPEVVRTWGPVPTGEKHHGFSKGLGLVFLCFVASFLGSWLFLASGLVKPDVSQTLDANRQTIVKQEDEVITDVAEKVSPSVVSIVTEGIAPGRLGQAFEGAGTGIIISKDGYVITNKHVIPENATNVSVVSSEGKTYDNVQVVGRDPLNDIAFLKIRDVNNLTAAKIGDSDSMEVGQKVVAIGNALGQFQNTVTTGVISGIGRPLTATDGQEVERLEDLFQTDAAINPGNSGGPLVNLNGEVIAINTAIADEAEAIGFAIPINAAKGVMKGVLENGKVERGYIGVRYISLNEEIAKELQLDVNSGAYLSDQGGNPLVPGGPAENAGLKPGDIITKVGDVEITQRRGLATLLSQYRPGEKVKLTVVRDGREQTIEVTLGRSPNL